MRCIVKKTIKRIIDSGNDYVLAVKANNRGLYREIASYERLLSKRISYIKTVEKNRGRLEIRRIYVFETPDSIRRKWYGSKNIIIIFRIREIKGRTCKQVCYYISSVSQTARQYSKGIRGHWLIENQLHWVKDVILHEDNGSVRNTIVAPILSLMKTIVMNVASIQGYSSIKDFLNTMSNNIEQMLVLLE